MALAGLGAAAAAAQFLEMAIKVGTSLFTLYSKIHDAPDWIKERTCQIDLLRKAASRIEESADLQTPEVVDILLPFNDTITELQKVLDKLTIVANETRMKKTWRTVATLTEERHIDVLFEKLKTHRESLQLFIQLRTDELHAARHQEILSGQHKLGDGVTYVQELGEHGITDESKCLRALFATMETDPLDDRSRLVNIKGERKLGTCEWVTSNNVYTSWHRESRSPLWISGGPGKGKTMIAIFLADKLAQQNDDTVIYFFCESRDAKRSTAIGVVRGFLYQLLKRHPALFRHVLPEFNIRGNSLFNDYEALWRLFEGMIRDPITGRVYCILDGLDECQEESLWILLKKIQRIPQLEGCNMKLITLSRDHPECIHRTMACFPWLKLDSDFDREVKSDIHIYISSKVAELSASKCYSENLSGLVKEAFLKRSQGTFLWVSFIIQELEKTSRADVEESLRSLPVGLDGMYRRMLLQISPAHQERVAAILRWVTMAVRPLRLSELGVAIGIPQSQHIPYEDVVLDHVRKCGQILKVNDGIIDLVHQSAKDYLLRTERDENAVLESFRVKRNETDVEIVKRCIAYIQEGAFCDGPVELRSDAEPFVETTEKDRKIHEDYPFLRYAAGQWPEHVYRLSEFPEGFLTSSDPFFRKDSKLTRYWLESYWKRQKERQKVIIDIPLNLSRLHMACLLGVEPLARDLIRKHDMSMSWYVNRRDQKGRTPLHWAVIRGQERIVRLLLAHKARIMKTDGSSTSLLSLSVKLGNANVIKLLIDKGANVNTASHNRQTPLHQAVCYGKTDIASLLIDRRADINAADNLGRTPLHQAACYGKTDIASLLIDRRADLNAADDDGITPLHEAAYYGYTDTLLLLIDNGADINATDQDRDTPLFVAAFRTYTDTVKLLVQKGATLLVQRNEEELSVLQKIIQAWEDGSGTNHFTKTNRAEQWETITLLMKAHEERGIEIPTSAILLKEYLEENSKP